MEEYSIKSIRENFKKKGVFYTPPQLGEFIKSLITQEVEEVYDPTCGRGSLLSIFPDNVKKYGQEIDIDAVECAKELVNADIRQGDTINVDAFPERDFRLIVANPPFSISYIPREGLQEDERFCDAPCLPPKSKADYLFLLHILAKLSEDGVAYVLNFPGILYRGNKEGKIREWLIEQNVIDAIYQIPPKQFTDTTIATCLLVLKKNRMHPEYIYMRDIETNEEGNVSIKDIKKNDCNLSVSSYVCQEKKVEYPSTIEMQEKAHRTSLHLLESQLKFSRMVCDMEGFNFEKYLDDFQELINNFRGKITFKDVI